MKTKHTQGEWEICKGVISTSIVSGDNDICVMTSGDSQINKANAKLIAAAPDMIYILGEIEAWLSFNSTPSKEQLSNMKSDIVKVIKKATE